MRMTGTAKPSGTEAAESELSVLVIPVEEGKKEEKTLMLSNALTELVVDSEENKQILGNGKGVEKKLVEIASDVGALDKRLNWEHWQSKNKM